VHIQTSDNQKQSTGTRQPADFVVKYEPKKKLQKRKEIEREEESWYK
jgi:hypothetical protein